MIIFAILNAVAAWVAFFLFCMYGKYVEAAPFAAWGTWAIMYAGLRDKVNSTYGGVGPLKLSARDSKRFLEAMDEAYPGWCYSCNKYGCSGDHAEEE